MSLDIVLFTMDEPLYMPRYVEPVLQTRADDIIEVVFAPHPEEDLVTTARRRYQMLGPLPFVRFGLRYGVGTLLAQLPDNVDRRISGRSHSVAALCRRHDVPVRTTSDVNDEEFLDHARSLDPDLFLSISAQQRFRESLLSLPDLGAINLHGSLLPYYRGRATAFWVLYHGEDRSGVTAHYMTSEYDMGDIILQRSFNIEPNDTLDRVYEKILQTGSEMAIDLIERIDHGEISSEPIDPEAGNYYSLPDAEDRREFKRRGHEFY